MEDAKARPTRRYLLFLTDGRQEMVEIPMGFLPLGGGGEIARLHRHVEANWPTTRLHGCKMLGEYYDAD